MCNEGHAYTYVIYVPACPQGSFLLFMLEITKLYYIATKWLRLRNANMTHTSVPIRP